MALNDMKARNITNERNVRLGVTGKEMVQVSSRHLPSAKAKEWSVNVSGASTGIQNKRERDI